MAACASVIIPAHDEALALPASLEVLLGEASADEFEVVVVANGCSDATADVARRIGAELGFSLRVVEITQASKVAALNAGDTFAAVFPRIYLDADVACSTTTLRGLVAALGDGKYELAVATRRLELVHASWWVRRYYCAWQQLPRVQAELSGRGAYGFSREGRERFERFPAITADDFWAVRQVTRDRAVVIPEDIVIRPPMDVPSLLRVRSRIYAANRASGVPSGGGPRGAADMRLLMKDPRNWIGGAVFLTTNAYVKTIAAGQSGPGRDRVRGSGVIPRAGDTARDRGRSQ